MRKAGLILSMLLVLVGCATFYGQVVEEWPVREIAVLKKGVVVKTFVSPIPPYQEGGIVFYVNGSAVYREWEEKGKRLAAVKTEDGWWEKGKPLKDYAPLNLDKDRLVFFLLVRGEPKRFEFNLS